MLSMLSVATDHRVSAWRLTGGEALCQLLRSLSFDHEALSDEGESDESDEAVSCCEAAMASRSTPRDLTSIKLKCWPVVIWFSIQCTVLKYYPGAHCPQYN
jgi:hypothetical protein